MPKSPDRKAGKFKIDEVFLGDAKQGDSIDIGDLQLSAEQQYGPSEIEPITAATRILFFLQPLKGSPGIWEPTDFKQSFFLVQRTEEVDLLRRAAERAVDLRKQWEQAAGISEPKQRVATLWPFLSMSTYGVSFLRHTKAELQKARPAAGEYFAEHFDEMSHNQRMALLAEADAFGSERLHDRLRKHLDQQRKRYEEFVASFGRLPQESDWNNLPEQIREVSGETYYGLSGFVGFHDHNDLPYIRAMALWSAKYHLEQTAEAALNGFRDMPDPANLAVINRIMAEFLPGRKPGISSLDWDAERALCKHNYAETVPVLARFVADDRGMAGEAEGCLAEIVGRDLGRDPQAWIDWYTAAKHTPPSQKQ